MADASNNQQAFPLGHEEIEQLVKSLYKPGSAKKVAETDATLRILQRSPQGWEIADFLLNSSDENVRFFGALTFTVKLSTDSAALSEEESQQLLVKLIHHLISHPASSPATRKLCSTLAQYFCKPISQWAECIRSLAISFGRQQPIIDDGLDDQPSTLDALPQLADAQLLVLLEFAMSLADEAKKIANTPNRTAHHRMIANIESIEVLLQTTFARGIKYLSTPADDQHYNEYLQLGERLAVASLKCFTGWIFYAQSELKETPEKLRYLRSVSELALACLEYHVDDAMELVAEVLENYPKFFEKAHQLMLWSAITSPWGVEILKNLDAETVSLSRVIVAYGQLLVDSRVLYQDPDNPHHQQVLTVLHGLLKYPEPVGIEDEVAPVVLDFWSNYVTIISDEAFAYLEEDEKPDWLGKAHAHVFQAMSELVNKITYPAASITKTWDDESKKTFKVFRVDVGDIIQEAYELLRDQLLGQLLNFTVHALETSNWLELESGLFCLISLSDLLTEHSDSQLQHLFQRPLFTTMTSNPDIPAFTRRAAVDTVAAFNGLFLRKTEYLPQVLPFLLSALSQPSLAHGAAKSFASLCSECRKALTNELGSFFQMYQQFLTYQTAEEFTKSRVLEGIAAIVQAQDSDEKRLAGMQHLFQFVANDAMQAINVTQKENDPEQGQVLALTTLRCLVFIGKAVQASDEEIIDLETDSSTPSDYWTAGPGKQIQNQIINFVNYLTQVFPANDEIIELACNVLKAGYKESVPGPFVLPPAATIDYILKTNIQTPRIPYILETACGWIASHKRGNTGEYEAQAQRLLRYVLSILQALQHPRNDPEISVGCVELIQKFVNTSPQLFTREQPEVLKEMFDFSIECLKSPEVLPKRASAQLWKDIFELAGNTKSPHQSTGQDIVNHFGPAVTFALLFNVCGEVDYTSLEHIVVPLRKFITADRNARTHITNALAEQPLIARVKEDPNTEAIVRKFIEGMFRNTRSSSAFKETVKEFWQKCKQIQMQFAQMMHPGHRFAHNPPAGF